MADLSPLRAVRRDKVLDAAERLFVARGFRATTMEAIAEAAGFSKVTLYGYFRDKEAAFEGVARRLADRLRGAALAALQEKGPASARITAALIAKHGMVHDLVRTSAFAMELMAQKALVGQMFRALDTEITEAIATLLGDDQAARILFDGAMGIANASTSRAAMEADIARLVAAVAADR